VIVPVKQIAKLASIQLQCKFFNLLQGKAIVGTKFKEEECKVKENIILLRF